MKISELVKRTGVSKETIHYYIREGLLRKPRKSGVNVAEYNEKYIDQIQLIKDLRNNYYLPIPEIKKIIKKRKKQSPLDQAVSELHSKYFRPVDLLFTEKIEGKEAFREATGLGRKWLSKAEEWGVINGEERNGKVIYPPDDVAIGKLMVDMDHIGFGPKDGHDPEDLRHIADFVREFVVSRFDKYYQTNLDRLSSAEYSGKASQFHEIISLFFYHLYRKFAREAVDRLLASDKKENVTETDGMEKQN